MFDERDRKYFYDEFKNNGYEVGSYDDFKKDLNNKEDRDWYYNEAKNMGYDVGTQADFDKMVLEPAPSTSGGGKQVDSSATTQSVGQKASTETKPQVAQPAKKQKTTDKESGLIAKVLDMIPTGVQTSNGTYQPSPEIPQPVVKGEEMPVKEESSSSSSANATPVTTPTGVVNNEGLMDAKLANYIENWKQRPDKQSTYFENLVADLLADGTANSNEEAVNMVMPALRRYANRSAMDVTNQVVSSLPDDTVQDAEQSIGAQWYSHDVQDKLKQEADSMGISYDDYVAHFLKPAMVQSLVNKYGPNYRNIAEGIATRLYSHDENVQDRLMNQDINDALSDVISKYTSTSVAKAIQDAEVASNAQMAKYNEQSKYVDAASPFAIGAIAEANKTRDPQKILSGLQQKFGKLYRNPEFLNDMSNAAFKVMQQYGLNGGMSGDPKQFKPMINAAIKNELDQLEVKGMIPRGSADYILKTGIENTIIGKVSRKIMQTDYQNWLEDIANQQYQPGFWENVASGSLTFAGDAWSYWLPGAAGGKLTKSMVAKAEGKLAGDLMAKGMERKMAERAAKVLIGKSKAAALKSGAVHGAVTFGGQSAISKPIDEVYRTGQFDENGMIYNPSVGKVIANTLGEVAKQSAVGAIMQGGTIANMVGKGRGLATNILADVGGKVVDSGIMTGQQMLERMAHDPNFKPTGKDAAESFLESMANLTAIGLPGMMGKYARFKDAREFNKKFDFTDQDIAELKRFGYDGLRDAFEKVSINGYRAEEDSSNSTNRTKLPVPYAEETQVLNLAQKYMDLMNDKSVPEVLKAKMMAVVEGKRPSSFSPVVDSVIVQPMDQDGKVYLETLNKDGGIIDRKEFSSLDEAQKADKKLEYEKTLGLASVLEGEFHNEFTQEHLEDLYNQAAQKYYIGYKLTDEEKAAVYLRQNAGTIDELIHNRQNGIILTDEEQKQLDTYRHFYDSALENSSVLREFVQTFEDSHGVARGTLRKALESKDKKYAPLVESYLKELYNSIELKREMKDTKEQMNQTEETQETTGSTQEGGASAQNAEATAEKPVDASVSSDVPPTEPPTPPVGGETPSNADDTPSVENNVSPSDADTASNESKSDAFVMGQNAYKNEDSEALQAIDYNSDLATGRLKRAFADNEKMPDIVANAYNEGRDMEQFVAQRASSLTPAQKEAISKYVEAMDAKKGAIDALQHADDGYGEALKQQLWPYQTEDGNIVPATLDSGKQVFLKKDNEYGGAFVVVPDEQGLPTIKQVSKASIIEQGTPVPLDEYIEKAVAQQKDARNKQFISQFDGSGLKPNDQVTVAMEEGDANINMTFAGYSEDGKIVLTDGKDYLPLSKEEFAAWRKNALDNTINQHLDAEDAKREQEAVSQAEADKKQRYANGIVGLSEGQPDYSSKDTDPNVAAEYLQEQFGEDHGKLLNLVNGSRDDIKTQLANKRKAAAEYQNWLDTNADLDPEKAKKVENELSLVNEQIADLDARFKNWNTIRNSVMTPDEVKAMKEERKAEIERAGIDKSSVLPDVDTGVRIPENSELKDKYSTQEAASGYITSERRRVYKMQEETQREIDGVDKILNQYMDGDMELSAEQLRDLNTTKAELANRQNALTADAKALKGKAESLNILYIKERAEQNKKNLEALSPKDRRKELVAKALEKKDMKAIKEIYKDASTDVMDLTPQTLEEFVSERLFPHSLNAESLAQELGSFNFKRGIGSKYDTNKYNYLLAKNGEGLTISELAKRVWEDLSSTMESGGGDGLQSMYTDQDVRNAILDMFKTYDSVREMRNVTLLNRIAAAENELSGEEEWYEQQKEREIYEKQAEIDEYKSYIHDKELSLPSESELDHIYGLEYDRMMEIEDREREYKQYVKSILPELADYDDRSNEEGYGGGSSLGSDSSRRGVDEGNSQGEEVGNGEASSESEIGEGSDSGRKGRQETGSLERGEGSTVRGSHLPQEASFGERLKSAIAETETEPTESQKKAGNYKKGHLSFGGYDYTVETPKGATRSGKDEQGKPWSVTMHDTYGYILGKIGVDGDHIDMFINDAADLDTFDGNVYVVDQVNPETGEFDEHKVMYGYPSEEAATEAYLANYSKGWKGLGKVTAVPKATFDKWLESSDRKTKPFADYAMIKKGAHQDFFSNIPEEEAKEKLQNVLQEMTDGKFPSEIDWNRVDSIYHSYYHRFGDVDADAAKYRKDVQTIWNKAYNNHLQEISKNKAESYVSSLNPFSLKEKIQMWKTADDVDSYVDHNVAYTISDGRSLKDDYLYDEHHSDFHVSLIEKFAHILAEKNYFLDAALQKQAKEKVPMREKILRDALIDVIKDSGIEVVTDNKEGQKVLDSIRNVITVYHGAGASFDHFNHSFMGSGEGAQAFGWGTYLTEVPGIANEYSKASSERKIGSPQKLYFKNEEVDSASYTPWMIAHNTLEKYGKDFDKAFQILEEKHQKYIKDNPILGESDENRGSSYLGAIGILKEEQKNPGSLVFEPAVFDERERNLYVVEIPKDNGDNYFNWDFPMSDVKYEKLSKLLSDKGIKVPTNKQGSTLYNQLAESLNSQKEASLMLSSLGFVGIKYPANYRSGGRKDGALNYVIFQEADAKIYEDYKFFRSSDGTVYGFVHDGKIYIDPSIATSEVPIHEYTHIWSGKLRSANPKEWDNIISLMKGTTIWNEVKNSNENLKTDSDIADEVLAIYSGRKGSQRIEEEFEKVIEEDSSLLDKAKAMNAIHKVKKAINKFWKAVTDFFHVHFGSAEEVADTVLRDFLNEVNPLMQKPAKEEEKTKQKDDNLPLDAPMSMDELPFHRDVKEVKPSEMTEAQKAKEEGEMLGFPAIDKEGEPINNHIIELVKWAKEQGLEIDPTSKLNSYADLFVMCKDDFGICTLVPDEGEDINQVVYFPDSAQVIDQLGKLQEEFNAGRDLKHSSNIDSELTEGVTFYDADTAREFKDFVNKKLEKQNKFHNKLNSKTIEVPEDETEENPLGSQLDQTNLPFHRDVKEVKPSEMTEAQKVAYDAVSTMLKKAGIPVKVVSNEDMEKVAEAQGKGVVYGYTDGKEIVLNQEHLNPNTPIHEYQHLWRTAAKNMNPELIEHGDKLIMQTQLFADLKEDPNYKHLSDDEICDEAFARLTGEDGAAILEQMAKDAIKENPLDTAKELSVINKLKEWLKKFWYWALDTFTKWKPDDIKKMTLEDIRNLVLRDLAQGVDPRTVKSRMTKEESVEEKIKAVSQQFGVAEADVAMYANAIKKGSTAEAARARANIKRHLLQANEDKISSFKELLKYTKPVNEALKENFGDVDAMIEERKKQVEAQRNAMEAARKRAEEEEAKRQKHLEELSVIPDDQLDKQYMDALAKGDDATAREMLDEAARRKGYDDTESAYQGVGAWAAPGNPGYESDKARRDDWESSGSDVNLEDMALGYTPQPDDYFSHPERYSQNTPHGLESVKAINTAIDAIKNGEKDVKVKVYRAVPTSVKEGKLRNGDWVTPSKKYAEMHGTNRLEGKYRIIEDEVPATQLWWDGNDANEFGFDDGKAYKYKNAKNNRKLNDLVTYDNKGDVIPPSKRFNSRKNDVRFMFAGEKGAAEADKANVMPRLGSATIGLKAAKDKVVELFNKAKSGEFNGKPQSIGTLTQEGKKFLEDLSGLKMKDKIDFVLNPSDLKHMKKDHFGDNEKDPGRNIPLTEEDLRSMVDVIMNPEQVVYGIEKMDNRKAFFFLKQAEDGTLNLAEIYSDKKGNLTAKSYYKTKKGVDQRVMEIKNSLLPTPEASSGSPLSDGKGINFFSIEQEKTAETAENERKIADSVVNTANKLGGAEATVYSSLDDVPEEYRSEVEQGAKGWYDPETHSVHVYLPNCEDGNEAQRTVFHEKIGHEGMEVLLGGEDGVRKFASFVYRSVGKDVRGKIIDFANKYDPDWKNPDRMNVGTQEYIAHLAEEGPKTAEDFSLWTKIKHYLIKVLKKLGVRVPGLLNDKDLRYYLMKAGKALHVWDDMPQEKQEAMMKQANNAEIKDALSDGAGKGKPRQKKGESTIQYMKRVQEWRKWKNAREDENDPEPPMFYDIDKDEAGKKEWAQLNKDWREKHHLAGEEPMGMPIRMEGEEDDAYMTRIHEYEKWQAAMKDQEDPMPDMFAFEKKKQEEVKRKYEDWLAKHDLLEQQQADLDLYEGKIYPAETNPKADDLEQQVMQDLAEVTSTDVSKEGAARTVKHAVIHRRKNMEEASADDAIYINDVKNRIEKMADSGAFDKLLSDYKGKPNKAEKLAEAIPYIIEAHRRLRDLAHDLNATDAFDKGHIHIQPDDVEAIQPFVADLIAETAKMHTVLKDDKEVKVYDDPQAVSEVANKLAQAINANHQGEEGFVPIDGTDILSKHVLPLVKQQIVPVGIDYKNLSPEMKAAIDSIRDWYNYTYDWLKDNHTLREDTGYNADYVNHIWDKEKSDKQAYAMYVENRQRTKSPNEKPRTISTLMEGISLGLVPKTTDITKMMAYYSRSNIEAWVNKTMLQELTGLNVIERNEDGEIVSSDPLLSSTPPFNLEQYQYFEIPGVGPVWVYNVSPKQMKVKNPITGKEKVLYSEASAGDRFGVVFETYQSSPFWKAFDTAASSAKKLELGFSGFHAGALTEVYMVQNMVEFGPKKAMANFMKYIFADTAKNHELPCFANPQDFQEAATHLVKFGATNDYAAADVQNMFDNMRDAMIKVQKKLKDGNKISGTVALATMPLKVATQMLSLINKGMDRALWDFLHDGLKLATYRMRADKTKERAKEKGWTEEELSRALDEDGQFVNDMFGGQHWDILGASHRTLRYAGRVLLSPDWNASTTRHFLALTGYGSIWNEATFENFKQYYQRLKHKELIPEDEGRRGRQISSFLCYGIGFMVFYEAIANGINAAFRALDEEKERKKAEEIRKTNPSYKSMYELAYGDEGMKWYDYLMRGNSLGQQSKIFMGRYADGTEMYIRHGKQFREVPEYLFNHKGELEFPGPMVQRMIGKANPMLRMTLDDINYLSDFQASHADQEIQRKYGKTIGLLYKDALYWAPFLIPSQENKEFKAVDFFFPSSKGFSPWKAQSYFKDFILSGDMEGVVMTYQSCQRNGIDPEAQIKAAIGSVKALESAEMNDGVTSLQEAIKRFDAAKSITEKKKMRQKMKKFLSQSDYKAFTQKEALAMVQGYLNGDDDLKEMEKAESKYLMKAKAEDVTEDWRIQNVWNGTMETYQEYQRLKDVDKAKANAFKNSKTNKRLFAARKAISAAKRKMNKAKKQMDGTNDAAKLVEIRNTRKELLKKLNGME